MKTLVRLALAGGAGLATTALFAGPATAAPAGHHYDSRPVFVQTDNSAGNAVAVFDRAPDGTLSAAGTYATGGHGGVLDGSVVDHLASQGSLIFDAAHHLLYAVNAGSNTLTVFVVDKDRLQRRQVIATGGVFPVSVAVRDHVVYVLNARDGGSIQGFLRVGHDLVRVTGWHRPLGLDPSATPEFVNTPGQIAFTPRGDQLVVTTKANGSQLDVFHVTPFGRPSSAPVVTPDPDGVPFAVTFDRTGLLDVAEAGPNAVARYEVESDGTLTFVDRHLTGQAATCWIVGTKRVLYVDSAGSATVDTFGVQRSGLVDRGLTSTDGGTVDATVSGNGRFLYVQTGATGRVDEYAIGSDGSPSAIGSVLVPGAVGGEGIASA